MVDTNTTSQGSSAFNTRSDQSAQYGVMPEQVTKQLQQGGEFIVIHRERGSSQPTIWASGDPQETKQLLKVGYNQLQDQRETT